MNQIGKALDRGASIGLRRSRSTRAKHPNPIFFSSPQQDHEPLPGLGVQSFDVLKHHPHSYCGRHFVDVLAPGARCADGFKADGMFGDPAAVP